MAKVIQIALTPNHGHLVALDSDGNIYWRPWNKRGWGIIEPVPVAADSAPAPVSGTVPTPSPTVATSVSAPAPTVTVIPSAVLPAVDSLNHSQEPA